MNIPKSLKLNRFVYVRIPKMSEEFQKHGFMATLPNNYSGDNNAPTAERKSDIVANADKYAKKKAEEKPKENTE